MRLPVIVSMGGVNAAGRTSGHQSFRRMVLESLTEAEQEQTLCGLSVMMGLVAATPDGTYSPTAEPETAQNLSAADVAKTYRGTVLAGTLVRRVEPSHFDVDHLYWQWRPTRAPCPSVWQRTRSRKMCRRPGP